jgi:hypothetical protein
VVAASAVVFIAGLVLYFRTHSDLWLDEAQTVVTAQVPLSRLPAQLRLDNGPPFYYVVLHFWIRVFGTGTFAVRALSGVFAGTSLVLVYFAGKRLAGREVGWITALLLACSPFAVRYATEVRAYSLLILLSLAGFLLLDHALASPRLSVLAGLAVVTGLLVLTHYWSFYLLGATGAVLVICAIAGWRRRSALMALVSMACGGLLFLPWLSTFLWQVMHTGTPWGTTGVPTMLLSLPEFYADGIRAGWAVAQPTTRGRLLALVFVMLVGIALLAPVAARERWRLLAWDRFRTLGVVIAVTVLLGLQLGARVGASFEARYTSVVFAFFMLLVAVGISRIPDLGVRAAVLGGVLVLGFLGSIPNSSAPRTHGGDAARYINAHAHAGDVVGYCPDQLSPPTHRLLRRDLREFTYGGSDPASVVWSDYPARMASTNPAAFARQLDGAAGQGHRVWLFWGYGYAVLGTACPDIVEALSRVRPGVIEPVGWPASDRFFEPSRLFVYPEH